MYVYIFGIALLKSMSPYFRKHLLNSLNPHDMLFLNTFIICALVACIFTYKHCFDKNTSIKNTVNNFKKLTITQFISIFTICILAIVSSLVIFDLDKNFNTPLLNFIFINCGSIVLLLLIGCFFFKEKYNWKQLIGILLILIGTYLISMRP